MVTKPRQSKGRDCAPPSLNAAIKTMNSAERISSVTSAKALFGSVSSLLTVVRDSVVNEPDDVELSLSCAGVCQTLDRGLSGRRSDELSQPVLEAVEQLTATVAAIQRKITERGKRNVASRLFYAKNDKDAIAAWRQDITNALHVFNTELAINTHLMVADIHHNVLVGQEGFHGQHLSTEVRSAITSPAGPKPPRFRATSLGELPPPSPRACFGRNELIENIVGFAENFEPIALIGTGGIGKTSIALTVLHHDRIKERFGANRRFVRCDQFPATSTHLLRRLSKVIGAGVENPENLEPLRRFLSSNEVLIILDNAESVLDPQGTDAQEIYAMVDELCQIKTICLCITSRITTVPRHCKRLKIPTLPMEAACDTFYGIYNDGGRSPVVDDLLRRLDFHPLSITLLATAASHYMWDYDRLTEEWDMHRAQALGIDYNQSLAATIELSLTSPTFLKLGPDARDLLGVVAFFPQGIGENNLDWLFPTISNRKNIFDKFCVLSLTHRSNGFVTMLAPIRDYLRPQDPESSPLLRATRNRYFSRLSVDINPHMPGFGEARWITSEDVNVEHLLDIFASIDTNSDNVWYACIHFLRHLFWHKQRHTVLTSRIELLPHHHPFKLECSYELSRLFYSVGKYEEQKRLLTYVLVLLREQGDDYLVAQTLQSLSGANLRLRHYKEGIQQAEEALEIFEQLEYAKGRAWSLNALARLFHDDKQLDAAEETASRAINLFPEPEEGEQFLVCQSHRILGEIHHSKGDREKAIQHFETARSIASPFNWHNELFWAHYSLALLSSEEGRFGDAHTHIGRAKSHAANNAYDLGCAVLLQARVWYRRRRLKEAASEALCALEIFEKLGVSDCLGACRALIRAIERASQVRPPLTTQISTRVVRHLAPRRIPLRVTIHTSGR